MVWNISGWEWKPLLPILAQGFPSPPCFSRYLGSWESKGTPPKLPPSINSRPFFSGTINHWFPLIRPAISRGGTLDSHDWFWGRSSTASAQRFTVEASELPMRPVMWPQGAPKVTPGVPHHRWQAERFGFEVLEVGKMFFFSVSRSCDYHDVWYISTYIYRHIYIYIVGLVNSKFFCQDHAISSTIFFVNDTYYGVWWSFGWAPRHTSLLMRWDLETRWSKAQTDPRFSCFALDK